MGPKEGYTLFQTVTRRDAGAERRWEPKPRAYRDIFTACLKCRVSFPMISLVSVQVPGTNPSYVKGAVIRHIARVLRAFTYIECNLARHTLRSYGVYRFAG